MMSLTVCSFDPQNVTHTAPSVTPAPPARTANPPKVFWHRENLDSVVLQLSIDIGAGENGFEQILR
jgi:hypothetical protein